MSLHLADILKPCQFHLQVLTRQKRVCVFIFHKYYGEKKLNYLKFLILNFREFIESIFIYSFSQHFPQKVWQ